MSKHVLDIEKYLDHQVNNCCETKMPHESLGPPIFNDALGVPLVVAHKKGLSSYSRAFRSEYISEYHMVDFEDFLDYATSNMVERFEIPHFPDKHICYYQALPGTWENPLFDNDYGKFSIMGVCLSRGENNLWINMQFKVMTQSTERDGIEAIDLVGSNNGFVHEFVHMRLMDYRKDYFSKETLARMKNYREDWFSEDGTPVEFTKYHVIPPFRSNFDYYNNNDYRITYSGEMWRDRAEQWQKVEWQPDAPAEYIEHYRTEGHRVKEFEDYHNKILADHFEIARLMTHLPSYFGFMYDLVKEERKKIGTIPLIGRKKKGKKKISSKTIYKIIKSLRVSYLAEEETRKKLNTPKRTWTAPSYKYSVKGHWRKLKYPYSKGHDSKGNEVIGKTWVNEYQKGVDSSDLKYGVDTREPNVVIKLKQPLSYARDTIKSHEASNLKSIKTLEKNQIGQKAQADKSIESSEAMRNIIKPNADWVYEERIKLTAGLRWMILKRDNYRCVICGKGAEDKVKLEVDHIIPVSEWGRTTESNLRTLCKECNRGKGSKA